MLISRALQWWHRLRSAVLLRVAKAAARVSRRAAAESRESDINAWRNGVMPSMRLKVCERCPLLTQNKFCRPPEGCGCYMPWKTQIPKARCPLGKW